MALLWADFPSGQKGLYGTNTAWMLNGIWAQIEDGTSTGTTTISTDPDPNISSIGNVFRTFGSGSSGGKNGARFALPVTGNTEGFATRVWLDSLPTNNDDIPILSFRNGANTELFAVDILSTGNIRARAGGYSAFDIPNGTVYGTTSGPAVTANAWSHIEIKATANTSTGSIEVRVNGITVLSLNSLNTGSGPIQQIYIGVNHKNIGQDTPVVHWKDIVFWDTTGTEVNDFQGAVSVYDLVPDGDDDLQWTTSSGSVGYDLINDYTPSNLLTASGAIANNDTVQIGSTYYRWTSGSVDTGTPEGSSGSPWLVALGASAAEAIENLYKAIGATGVAGTNYSTNLTAHTTVTAVGFSATAINIRATDGITSNIACTETGANLAWTASTLTGGPTDLSYISADDTPPSPSIFTMTDLPPDVTSVRAVIPIGRMIKTDGGDCNIQMSVSPDGTNWDAGSDRPITTAYTWWWDVSEVSPATAVRWTPTEVNNLEFRIDRTL